YGALYFVKQKFTLGAFFRDLTDEERQELQTNRGVYVTLVVDGTPAFENDILPGDVLLDVNGQALAGQEMVSQVLSNLRGQRVTFTIKRGGQKIQKTLILGAQ
ncbi:MAG TPA: PDZ domain-containing protein, partial [Rhodanobacteraceae bacterium]|nr:PDZ domain-containing protein [Rhodanobacteraceae bacterium]